MQLMSNNKQVKHTETCTTMEFSHPITTILEFVDNPKTTCMEEECLEIQAIILKSSTNNNSIAKANQDPILTDSLVFHQM